MLGRKAVSMASTRVDRYLVSAAEFQKGSEVTQEGLRGRKAGRPVQRLSVAARPPGPVLPKGSWLTVPIPIAGKKVDILEEDPERAGWDTQGTGAHQRDCCLPLTGPTDTEMCLKT